MGITSTVVGKAIAKPILRSGAKSGDDIWISNQIGRAQLGLNSFIANSEKNKQFRKYHCCPEPRLELAAKLAQDNLASAMIDVSDGLFQDLLHIAEASNLSAQIELLSISAPITFDSDAENFLKLCSSGDDYELLFSASSQNRSKINAIGGLSLIGQFRKPDSSASIYLGSEEIHAFLGRYGIKQLGYCHF